mmetsp:Transcript_14449/g.27070  ORF Transcript_14449/g.27070 Transcript_14449/m.27070 type:complete len:204 (+) Transcript_14449:62-673(+)
MFPFAMGGMPMGMGMGLPVVVRDMRPDRSGPPRVATVRIGGVPVGSFDLDPMGMPFPGPFPGHLGADPFIMEALMRQRSPSPPRYASSSSHSSTMELYHETSPDCAEQILSSQRMRRGSAGLAGGGIYFAESPQEARSKANSHGVLLRATVRVGNMKTVHRSTDETYTELQRQGYDSVKLLGRPSGTEYVVYNWDQVTNIRRA